MALCAVRGRNFDEAALESLSRRWGRDKEIMAEAVECMGIMLKHASPEIQDDKAVVLAAVKKGGLAVKHASERLRGDKEVFLEAVKHYNWLLRHASVEIQELCNRGGGPSKAIEVLENEVYRETAKHRKSEIDSCLDKNGKATPMKRDMKI